MNEWSVLLLIKPGINDYTFLPFIFGWCRRRPNTLLKEQTFFYRHLQEEKIQQSQYPTPEPTLYVSCPSWHCFTQVAHMKCPLSILQSRQANISCSVSFPWLKAVLRIVQQLVVAAVGRSSPLEAALSPQLLRFFNALGSSPTRHKKLDRWAWSFFEPRGVSRLFNLSKWGYISLNLDSGRKLILISLQSSSSSPDGGWLSPKYICLPTHRSLLLIFGQPRMLNRSNFFDVANNACKLFPWMPLLKSSFRLRRLFNVALSINLWECDKSRSRHLME